MSTQKITSAQDTLELSPRTKNLLDAIHAAGGYISLYDLVSDEILWRYGDEEQYIEQGLVEKVASDTRSEGMASIYLRMTIRGYERWKSNQTREEELETLRYKLRTIL